MPLNRIANFLDRSSELKALSARARELAALQAIYAGAAPREIAAGTRVRTCKAGTLVVTAENAAVAAKLRQMTPRILAAIRESAPEVTGLRVEVEVIGARGTRPAQTLKKGLGGEALQRFDALSKTIADGPLKAAVAKLVRHHRKR